MSNISVMPGKLYSGLVALYKVVIKAALKSNELPQINTWFL